MSQKLIEGKVVFDKKNLVYMVNFREKVLKILMVKG